MASSAGAALVAAVLWAGTSPIVQAPIGGTCPPKPAIPPGSCISGYVCAEGVWEPTYKVAGSDCDDQNACTYGDKCDANGACTGTAVTCTSDKCTTRTCNGTATCTVAVVPIDDGNPCTADRCDLVAGVTHTPTPNVPCDDGNLCTYGDICSASGACVGTALACTSDDCASRACNGTSSCSVTYAQAGAACGGDAVCGCASGQCIAGAPTTQYCYDAVGNLTAQVTRGAGSACLSAPVCP